MLSLLFLSETQTEMSKVYRSSAQKNSFSGSSNVSVINIQMEHIKTRLRITLSVQRIQRICCIEVSHFMGINLWSVVFLLTISSSILWYSLGGNLIHTEFTLYSNHPYRKDLTNYSCMEISLLSTIFGGDSRKGKNQTRQYEERT